MFTIGADPELFFKNRSEFISIVGLIGGTKEQPKSIGKGCAIQEDNVAAEFCIPPSESAKSFIESIEYSLKDLEIRANTLGLSLASNTASAVFSAEQLDSYAAQVFGCDPDFNAYTKQMNERPVCRNKNLRSAGGHVHVGTDLDKYQVIKNMDLFLGVPSVLIDPDTNRRKLYGKAGSFRPKPYGVEYRTLSNFWIWKKDLINWVYNQTLTAVRETVSIDEQMVQDCINNNSKRLAKNIVKTYGIQMP